MIPPLLQELTVWNTGVCNLRCKYCFVYELYEDQPQKSMTEETVCDLLHFARHHLAQNGSIWFFGAEPFVGFDIMRYTVDKAVSEPLSIKFGVTTNCTLLDEEKVKWMAKHGFGILCSLDLSEGRHDKYRVYPDGRGSWKQAWRGLQLVRKYLNPTPQIRGTFGPGTIEGLADDIKWLVEQGLTNMAVDAVYEVDWDEEDYAELGEEFKKLRGYYEEWYGRNLPVFSMFVRDAISSRVSNKRQWVSRCGLGQGAVGVDVNGDIYPCHRFVASRAIPIGNVRMGFDPERLHWIERWEKCPPYSEAPERCLDCGFKKACIGGCPAANYDLFGDPHVIPETICRVKQIGLEHFGDLYDLFKDNEAFKRMFLKKWQIRE